MGGACMPTTPLSGAGGNILPGFERVAHNTATATTTTMTLTTQPQLPNVKPPDGASA